MVKKKKISKKINKHIKNKRKLTFTIVAAVLVASVLIGLTLLFNTINTTNIKNQTIAETDKPAADHLHDMAVEAEKTNVVRARALFETAMRQYQYVFENTTDQAARDDASNGIQDCIAQIFMIDSGAIK